MAPRQADQHGTCVLYQTGATRRVNQGAAPTPAGAADAANILTTAYLSAMLTFCLSLAHQQTT